MPDLIPPADPAPEPVVVTPKPWYTSKTAIASILMIALYAVGLILDLATPLALPPTALLWLGIGEGVLFFALRLITTAPIQGSPGEAEAAKL